MIDSIVASISIARKLAFIIESLFIASNVSFTPIVFRFAFSF